MGRISGSKIFAWFFLPSTTLGAYKIISICTNHIRCTSQLEYVFPIGGEHGTLTVSARETVTWTFDSHVVGSCTLKRRINLRASQVNNVFEVCSFFWVGTRDYGHIIFGWDACRKFWIKPLKETNHSPPPPPQTMCLKYLTNKWTI